MASEPETNGKSNGNGTMAHQLEALERAIEDIIREGGANAIAVAEQGRRILTEARALAEGIARTSTAEIASGATAAWQRARDVTLEGAEAARETVRAHPLTVLGGVAALSALTATIVTLMVQDAPRRRYRF